MGAATVSILRLPSASIIIAMVVSGGGASATPLIIVAVVVAYLVVLALWRRATSAHPKPLTAESPSKGHGPSPKVSTDELQQ